MVLVRETLNGPLSFMLGGVKVRVEASAEW